MADTVRTQDELLTQLFQDGQPDGSISAQDMRDLIVSMPAIMGHGWEFHLDGTYTLASKLSIAAGVRTKITNDHTLDFQSHPITTYDNTVHTWNTTTNKFEPNYQNSFGTLRFAVSGWSDSAQTNNFLVEADVGGTAQVIFEETAVFAKGSGTPQSFNFTMPIFVGADFLANGGEIFITPESDASFWQVAFTIVRNYVPVM